MIWRTGLASWEVEFPFPGSLISTFLLCTRPVRTVSWMGPPQGKRAPSPCGGPIQDPCPTRPTPPMPESKQGSPKVNFLSRAVVFKSQIANIGSLEGFTPLHHSGVVVT